MPAGAALKTIGKGETLQFDVSRFPTPMKSNYKIMQLRCVKCHSMERTVFALLNGIAPISSTPFDRNATKAYGIKMMRKSDSGMSKDEVKATVELMNYILDEANH
jgi:hypothetical protein